MPPQFGTSGLRGLVTELEPELVANYVRAFLRACPQGREVYIGRDLRPSSQGIANTAIETVQTNGLTAVDAGEISTPALALAATAAGCAAIMITGSHIPADRNGLKFYTPTGEITKTDELAITGFLGSAPRDCARADRRNASAAITTQYVDRYVTAFGDQALRGLTIGIYEHSSVARDVLGQIMRALGASTVSLARSDVFIPVDTEAVDPGTRQQLAHWCAEHDLDAIVSTDGDADRPMLAEASGAVIPGDILGAITARSLGANIICTPVSSNSNIEMMPDFEQVQRTKIGSPYVIAAMEAVLSKDPAARVAGYEPNGGFLLGFTAPGPIAPLLTRDSVLPLVAVLADACTRGTDIAALAATLPPRYTAADRLKDVPSARSRAFIDQLENSPAARANFFEAGAPEAGIDVVDGLRVRFTNNAIIHLRPSGNAPECRCYCEADHPDTARDLVDLHLARLADQLPLASAR